MFMVNRVCARAIAPFGLKVILDDVTEAAYGGHVLKAELSHDVDQRWLGSCKILLRVLEKWEAHSRSCQSREKEAILPLDP